ncbi:ATP-dependent endonuclease [[Flexibacter] sp. ATCC 35208]|uniref:ATP-dependent nuclease n=1 Tax=[Flexibacter] sp. ATCC 35208 TaxID=1936242 RepID=UPI0009C6C0B5|nr:AAA family ATPase [[Flexibacter] sp. ATCC 35208]OMP74728.1 hypothetical protein BW716_33845 [[Flexibacter] sp. ATCC 35208]
MYVSRLRLWNFRKFGGVTTMDIAHPNLDLLLHSGLNLLIGENDSGKTAIIDAIKLVLKTHSGEWIKVEDDDFHLGTSRFRIECIIEGFTTPEAKNFTEWLAWNPQNNTPYLKLMLDISKNNSRILPADVKAGADDEGQLLTADARDNLKITYLRPLRDAVNELSSRRNSRLSQILNSHEAFKDKTNHLFVTLTQALNAKVGTYFKGTDDAGVPLPPDQQAGKQLKDIMDGYLDKFSGKKTTFNVTSQELRSILESLSLLFENEQNLGLGSHNLLCMAAELLHLEKQPWDGLRLGLIEEIEAHLHPQVQMQVIETLQKEASASSIQLLITTHSPNIGSKIKLENLIICQNAKAFSMGSAYTQLSPTDYTFLERFLDTTKANLFFARGVILVEGWAEELLLPVLAQKIGINLTKKGVSIINVGSTALLRYAKIFQRQLGQQMHCNVAVVTDVDIRPIEHGETYEIEDPVGSGNIHSLPYTQQQIDQRIIQATATKKASYNGQVVETFVSPFWTLEYCIALSTKLRQLFYTSALEALKEQRIDADVQRLANYDSAIQQIPSYFNRWQDSASIIAYAIYNHIWTGNTSLNVKKEPISKTIVAQQFANALLADQTITDYETERSLTYIFNAIRHAANQP